VKICVIIPSYNESKTIGALVKKIKAQGLDVLVIDDGSIDNTSVIATQAGAELIRQDTNRGKGNALKEAFRFMLNKDYQAVITMDADGQHNPEDIPHFIEAAINSKAEMVIGNRMSSRQGMPLVRWLTNNFMSFLISIICRCNIRDSQCGFRLIKRRLLEKLHPISDNYEIESEIIVQACRKGFQIKFIPVQTIYASQTSQINPVIDTIRFFKYLFKNMLR
jgi:glycosyltransferase involved in cell wall biosynthesis